MLDATVEIGSGELADVLPEFDTRATHERETLEARLEGVRDAMHGALKSTLPRHRMPEVTLEGKVFRLSGRVTLYYHKQLAGHGAMTGVPHGFRLVNDIDVVADPARRDGVESRRCN